MPATKTKKSSKLPQRQRNVVPDKLDLRDRMYLPPVSVFPLPELEPKIALPVLDQKDTNACTGFALANVVCHLQRSAGRKAAESTVSPFMLYAMARHFDEFPGEPELDNGSSVRGAMKGWFKFGVCKSNLWPDLAMPAPATSLKDDWWLDAVRRPLGAYYRIDTRSITDMHVALNEVGVIYASAICHSGWNLGLDVKSKGWWSIPHHVSSPADGGHAFVIVGYNSDGFIIQNSWGEAWGTKGRAVLSYEDWLENAMDCWVAQLGVATELNEQIARAPSLRLQDGKVQLANNATLRAREITPFIIDMENNGRLSNTGDYHTNDDDIDALVTHHLEVARTMWGIGKNDVIDIAIYAHGGLTSEKDAAATAARWIPALYDNKIFPIFLMWETDLMSTLKNRFEDLLKGEPRTVGGLLDVLRKKWNERLERLLAFPGTSIWGEMKQNAEALSLAKDSGGLKLYQACAKAPLFADLSKVRLHLIGHSAGSIVHSYIVKELCARGWKFETINFMAPAVRMDVFQECVVPHIKNGNVKRLNQFHLADDIEQKDSTCSPILGYSRSLLYLVSHSFESGKLTPLLGMEKFFNDNKDLKRASVKSWSAPCAQSKSTTHGGFDDDEATMKSIIKLVSGGDI